MRGCRGGDSNTLEPVTGLRPLLARHQFLQQRLLIHYLFAKRLDHDVNDRPLEDKWGFVEIIDGGLAVPPTSRGSLTKLWWPNGDSTASPADSSST